jgi:hypothetical protein
MTTLLVSKTSELERWLHTAIASGAENRDVNTNAL